MFYVYEWFIKETNEIFYVGKGKGKRYLVKKRNNIFNQIIKNNDCDVRIIAYFENESDAFDFEEKRIRELKAKNLARANKDFGGNGGVASVWTEEMKKRMSENNPMKDSFQKERMSKNNPMKNKDCVERMVKTKSKTVIINNIKYDSVKEASLKLEVCPETIYNWVKRGYDTNGNSCYYEEVGPKNFQFKKSSSKAVFIDNLYFSSLKEACNFLGVKDTSPLCKALKQNKPYKGHICKYANQQPS